MKRLAVLFLIPLFVYTGCGGDEFGGNISQNQWKLFSFFAKDTDYMMYVNIEGLRDSEYYENMIKPQIAADTASNWLADLERETGVGFKKGIAEIYTGSSWGGRSSVAVVFDDYYPSAGSYFRNPKRYAVSKIEGKEVFEPADSPGSYFYFIDDRNLVMINDRNLIKTVLSGSGGSVKENKDFIKLIRDIDINAHYWMAAGKRRQAYAIIAGLIGGGKNNQARELLGSVKSLTLAARFEKGVTLESNWRCSSSKDAYLLATAIRSAVAMDILSQQDYALGEAVKDLDVDRTGNKIELMLNLSREKIEDLRSVIRNKLKDKQL